MALLAGPLLSYGSLRTMFLPTPAHAFFLVTKQNPALIAGVTSSTPSAVRPQFQKTKGRQHTNFQNSGMTLPPNGEPCKRAGAGRRKLTLALDGPGPPDAFVWTSSYSRFKTIRERLQVAEEI